MATPVPKIMAPPVPCNTRKQRKDQALGASPASSEARLKTTVPMVNTFLRPTMSARRPKGIRKTAAASR